MNRQIKFRGRRTDNGEWVYGIPINTHIGTFIVTEENPHVCDQFGYMEIDEFAKVDPSTVGQFTGLKDCEGKDIYEGDLLEVKEVPTVPMEVKWNNEQGSFCLAEHTQYQGVLLGSTPIGEMLREYKMKIIGTIHERKEE